jgi:hypothetical protein
MFRFLILLTAFLTWGSPVVQPAKPARVVNKVSEEIDRGMLLDGIRPWNRKAFPWQRR